MCIRDRLHPVGLAVNWTGRQIEKVLSGRQPWQWTGQSNACLLYTSDAADERSSVDLGGRRIIKKKKTQQPLANTDNNNKYI